VVLPTRKRGRPKKSLPIRQQLYPAAPLPENRKTLSLEEGLHVLERRRRSIQLQKEKIDGRGWVLVDTSSQSFDFPHVPSDGQHIVLDLPVKAPLLEIFFSQLPPTFWMFLLDCRRDELQNNISSKELFQVDYFYIFFILNFFTDFILYDLYYWKQSKFSKGGTSR